MLVTESISCSTADYQLVLLVIQTLDVWYTFSYCNVSIYIYTICFLVARLSVLLLPYYILPFFYHEELSLSCLYIRYCVILFDFFSTLNLKSGEKSKIPDTLKSSIVFEMTYTCIHIFFSVFHNETIYMLYVPKILIVFFCFVFTLNVSVVLRVFTTHSNRFYLRLFYSIPDV